MTQRESEFLHKAEKAHWEHVWSESTLPAGADPAIGGIRNLFVRRMDELFRQILGGTAEGKTMLELGCGGSVWLPYFAKRFGLRVSGVDYSEKGCRLAEEILKKESVEGRIHRSDFFDPPDELLGRFDVVYSAGVAEHFDPTAPCLAAFARYLAPGGLMITVVPNMTGAVALLLRKFNRQLYDIHVPLSLEALRSAHETAGLRVEQCGYFLSTGCVASTSGLKPGIVTATKRQIIDALRRLAAVIWWAEDRTIRIPETRLLSPFVVCVARKP
jgi:2-polyprenyl-3-methyl-5-hydroxy-6-metoxy-1,4-benzoquinol methylase